MQETILPPGNSLKTNRTRLLAFTLAEVLITLGIVGMVAQMTIPTLMNNVQDKVTITELKKVYSELLQATELIKLDEGEINEWIPDVGAGGSLALVNIYAKKMNVIKNCTTAGTSGCMGDKYKYLRGTDYPYVDNTNNISIILGNGTSLIFDTFGKSGNSTYGNAGTQAELTYGSIYVDVNGPKKPNVIGQDVFSFFITKNSITPYGSKDIKSGTGFDVATCRRTDSGHGCAAWVIYNGNMDYLDCKTGTEDICSTLHW